MAFIRRNFNGSSVSLAATETGNSWIYETTDSSTTVLVAGYFDEVSQIINKNDIVALSGSDGLFLLKFDTVSGELPAVVSIFSSGGGGGGGSLSFTSITSAVLTELTPNNGFACSGTNYVASFNLPTTSNVGDTYFFINQIQPGAGPYGKIVIQQKPGQMIAAGSISTTRGVLGYLWCIVPGTCFSLYCTVADTDWILVSYPGFDNLTPAAAYNLA